MDTMTRPQVSVVIPCYVTGNRIERLFSSIEASLSRTAVTTYEIIFVVDGSPDDTWDYVSKVCKLNENAHGVRLMRNFGQHAALLAGIRKATGEIIVTMDDDFQHDPDDIPKLLSALTSEYDLVYGVSSMEEHSFFRNAASQTYKWVAQHFLGMQNARNMSAFRAFRRELASGFDQTEDPFAPIDVLLSWTTTRIRKEEVEMHDREDGVSGYTVRKLISHAINDVTGYSTKPLRIVTTLGLVVFGISFLLLIGLIVNYLTGKIMVAGYASLAIMIALFSGAQLLSLGVIGEYLGKIHKRNMGMPRYVIRDEV
jgi:undecaprenyl-phosphate 4-deoxy-4-formamido-L-arabinose transferase